MKMRLGITFLALLLPVAAPASTLHGRIKDQQCSVLSHVIVMVQSVSASKGAERTATTDDAGNYALELPAGAYKLCMKRNANAAPSCTNIEIVGTGDTWITTQLRDTLPDLSHFSNRAY